MAPRKRKRLRTIWSDFVYGALHNPRTTLTALGVAIPILYKAIEQNDWHLALSGLGTFLGGLFAKDAKREVPQNNLEK